MLLSHLMGEKKEVNFIEMSKSSIKCIEFKKYTA